MPFEPMSSMQLSNNNTGPISRWPWAQNEFLAQTSVLESGDLSLQWTWDPSFMAEPEVGQRKMTVHTSFITVFYYTGNYLIEFEIVMICYD